MPSQFTIYTSYDSGSPQLYGSTGSLVAVLNACLVTGYINKLPAGWSADFTSSIASGSTFRPPSGSRCYLNVRDMGAPTAAEARVRGYESMTAFDTGSGMFPMTASFQGLPGQGLVTVRKSNTSDISSSRLWVLAADAYTMYMWIGSGTSAPAATYPNIYDHAFWFGDIYSFEGSSDIGRCMIMGRTVESVTTATPWDAQTSMTGSSPGQILARSYNGSSGSITFTKFTDYGRTNPGALIGYNAYPSGPDKAVYLSPFYVAESNVFQGIYTAGVSLRGRLRGLYGVCHSTTYFIDGQTITGTQEYAGKTFRILKTGATSLGNTLIAIETSNTVETN